MDCRQQKGPAEHRAAAKRTQIGQNMEATRACYSTDYLVTLVSGSVIGPFVSRSVSPERSIRPGSTSSSAAAAAAAASAAAAAAPPFRAPRHPPPPPIYRISNDELREIDRRGLRRPPWPGIPRGLRAEQLRGGWPG